MEFINLMFHSEETLSKWNERDKFEAYDDLNLDKIVDFIKARFKRFPDYFFGKFLHDKETAGYRLDIFKEIYIDSALFVRLEGITQSINALKEKYADYMDITGGIQQKCRFLYYVNDYVDCVRGIAHSLKDCRSEGLSRLHGFCVRQIESSGFTDFTAFVKKLVSQMDKLLSFNFSIDFTHGYIKMSGEIKGADLLSNIGKKAEELLGIEIRQEFSVLNNARPLMEIEAAAIGELEKANPDVFAELDRLFNEKPDLYHMLLFDINEQLHFYAGYISFIREVEAAGHAFCFPRITEQGTADCAGAYDLSLALRMIETGDNGKIITNGIDLKNENGFILTGANQGGKTTYLRSAGLCAFLANNGLPIPASSCGLPYFDNIFTHFVQPESMTLKSRLEDEVHRLKSILSEATDKSLILINEGFTSTTRMEGLSLLLLCIKEILSKNGMFGCVTHYYELYDMLGETAAGKVAGLVAEVDATDSKKRLYVITRSSGVSSYADDIVAAAGMTPGDIKMMLGLVQNG